jgi:hypothetical protein
VCGLSRRVAGSKAAIYTLERDHFLNRAEMPVRLLRFIELENDLDRMIMKKKKIKWFSKPQKHDYLAAQSYLSLTFEPRAAKNLADKLKRAKMTQFAAKDIFRSSGLSLLGVSNSHVERDRSKIVLNESLSPLLLCRDKNQGKLIIADGYHRLCAVYTFDEDGMIPCKIV